LRRQSARFKSEESEPTEHLFEIDKASGPTIVKLVHTKEHADKKRFVCPCLIVWCEILVNTSYGFYK
jgi:hypothetical protein